MAVMEHAEQVPPARLSPLVASYSGYRYEGLPPGTHHGLPSPYVTIVLSLGKPTRTRIVTDQPRPAEDFAALAGGLHTRAVLIEHDGDQYGVQLALTPYGARSLLGMPAGELAWEIVELDGLLPRTGEVIERMAEAPTWPARFAVLNEVLTRAAGRLSGPSVELRHAWDLLTERAGLVRVDEVAREVGWSRRHLHDRFTAEFGLTPKEAARVMRFEQAKRLLRRPDRPSLATVAATCGFYDQAHLAREWNGFVGCPPSAWLTGDDLPFLQAAEDAADAR